jgi:hypothetical protein
MSKNYISTFIKEREGKYGKFMTVSMKLEELNKLPVDKYGNVKVIIQGRREPDKFGNTHSMIEDTYQAQQTQIAHEPSKNRASTPQDDLPF